MKISLLFLTLETVDFESEHFFESHGQLQSAADLMPALTYVHLTHFVTGVGSSNLIYGLTVVITFRNVL